MLFNTGRAQGTKTTERMALYFLLPRSVKAAGRGREEGLLSGITSAVLYRLGMWHTAQGENIHAHAALDIKKKSLCTGSVN